MLGAGGGGGSVRKQGKCPPRITTVEGLAVLGCKGEKVMGAPVLIHCPSAHLSYGDSFSPSVYILPPSFWFHVIPLS